MLSDAGCALVIDVLLWGMGFGFGIVWCGVFCLQLWVWGLWFCCGVCCLGSRCAVFGWFMVWLLLCVEFPMVVCLLVICVGLCFYFNSVGYLVWWFLCYFLLA